MRGNIHCVIHQLSPRAHLHCIYQGPQRW